MGDGPRRVEPTPVRKLYADPAAAQAVDKIAAARVWLLKEKPFFGVLARALRVEPTLSVAALRLTDDDRLLANPAAVLEMKLPSLCARIAHVAMHAALAAHVRRGPREPLRWNTAHDLAVEPLLAAAQLACGPAAAAGVALAPGASAEEYYLVLAEGTRPDDAWCDLADPPPPPGSAFVAGTFTRQDGPWADGGGEASRASPAADEADAFEGAGEQERASAGQPAPGAPPGDSGKSAEARGRELQWKMRLAVALEEERASGGKTFGDVPDWIDEIVRATIEPPPDWAATLQQAVSILVRTDRSFLRPSRRMSALVGPDGDWPDTVTMPGRRVRPAGQLVAVVDTSASISSATLERFLGALASVATAEGFDEVRLVQADAGVTRDEVVFAGELLSREVSVVGRGGTDFGPALRLLARDARRSRERFTVVYLTDLDGAFPAEREALPLEVVWVVPGKAPKAPPFGGVLEMPPGAGGRG